MILPVLLPLSLIAVFADFEISRWSINSSSYLLLSVDVHLIKSVYNAGIEDRIYIHFAKTHLCDQV